MVAFRIAATLPASITVDDLFTAGVLGLYDAFARWSPDRGANFKTFAEHRVRGAILDELRAQDWIPRSVREKVKLVDRTIAHLESALGRLATDDEVAAELGMTPKEFQLHLSKIRVPTVESIEELAEVGDIPSTQETPEDIRFQAEQAEDFSRMIKQLSIRKQQVIRAYFYEDRKMKEIGQSLGITESRVSQLLQSAVADLREKFETQNPRRRARGIRVEMDNLKLADVIDLSSYRKKSTTEGVDVETRTVESRVRSRGTRKVG